MRQPQEPPHWHDPPDWHPQVQPEPQPQAPGRGIGCRPEGTSGTRIGGGESAMECPPRRGFRHRPLPRAAPAPVNGALEHSGRFGRPALTPAPAPSWEVRPPRRRPGPFEGPGRTRHASPDSWDVGVADPGADSEEESASNWSAYSPVTR
ncbi:hypothetical protein GCM10009716_03180 [Streptomyces sodiiphilus]|uniref:Uncharacterized protein n=1 Tax=Streptomyces sodiiphilus TaxID=226217 RepID=A0ABN2NQT0_9ACTN